MFIDARKVLKETVIKTDVCIIGAGAAGITLAKEFTTQSFRVCLLESGGLEPDKKTQSLYEGENVGLKYSIKNTRFRFFGGSTNYWTGMCSPLDENTFEYRPWIPYSGWPFTKAQVIPFYKRAQPYCELGPFIYDTAYWEDKLSNPDFKQLSFPGNSVDSKFYQRSFPPTRFGKAYRQDIEQAGNITTYLHANVIDIETTGNENHVMRVKVATLDSSKFWVSAKIFILATGGIENARLLLLSNKKGRTPGVGNQYDLVGRFFMEHPRITNAGLFGNFFFKNIRAYDYTFYRKKKLRITTSKEVQEQEKLPGFVADLAYPKKPGSFEKHVGNVIADLNDDNIACGNRDLSNIWPEIFDIIPVIEQSCNPDSRITLSNKRDILGLRQARLDWRLNSIDMRAMSESLKIIGEEFMLANLGRIKRLINNKTSWDESIKLRYGYHHMGTTRMNQDPRKGVVDQHCRVYGIDNLYISGSSVFPTGGTSNPTLTIIALSIRLADHVKKIML